MGGSTTARGAQFPAREGFGPARHVRRGRRRSGFHPVDLVFPFIVAVVIVSLAAFWSPGGEATWSPYRGSTGGVGTEQQRVGRGGATDSAEYSAGGGISSANP